MKTSPKGIRERIRALDAKNDELYSKCVKSQRIIDDKISKLRQTLYGISTGDRVQVTSLTIRHRFRDTDIELLGKYGVVKTVEKGRVSVLIDGSKTDIRDSLPMDCVSKIID